MEIITYL